MREQQNPMLTRNTTLENTPGSLPTGVDYHEQNSKRGYHTSVRCTFDGD